MYRGLVLLPSLFVFFFLCYHDQPTLTWEYQGNKFSTSYFRNGTEYCSKSRLYALCVGSRLDFLDVKNSELINLTYPDSPVTTLI
jgi:hypothetical protein